MSIRGGVAWRLQIADAAVPGDPDLSEARELLASWRFVEVAGTRW